MNVNISLLILPIPFLNNRTIKTELRFEKTVSISELLAYLKENGIADLVDRSSYIVVLNDSGVGREEYETRILKHLDRVTIIPLISGG